MTTRLAPPAIGDRPAYAGHAITRCLHSPRPEHRAGRLITDGRTGTCVKTELPDVELAINQLVTNAGQHVLEPYELRIFFDRAAKVVVLNSGADHDDLARKLLQVATSGLTDGESGRGLQIMTGFSRFASHCARVDAHRAPGSISGRAGPLGEKDVPLDARGDEAVNQGAGRGGLGGASLQHWLRLHCRALR